MTVVELIGKLREMPQDMPVMVIGGEDGTMHWEAEHAELRDDWLDKGVLIR